MSEGRGEEWVYVDLGAPCTFDRVVLHWIAPRGRRVDPGVRRRDGVADAAGAARVGVGQDDDLKLASARARRATCAC